MSVVDHPVWRDRMPTREALMLSALLDHPWLLSECREKVESLRFTHPDAAGLCFAMERAPADTIESPESLLDRLKGYKGAHRIATQVRAIVTPAAIWGGSPTSSRADVRTTFAQLASGFQVRVRGGVR
jgi:DNA primase